MADESQVTSCEPNLKTLATGFVFSFVVLTSQNGLQPYVEFVVVEIPEIPGSLCAHTAVVDGFNQHSQQTTVVSGLQFKSFIRISIFAQNLDMDTLSA